MANYSTKMRVFQDFGTAPTGTATEQNVFVFGPKYDLHRYTDDAEKAQLPANEFVYDWGHGEDVTLSDVFSVPDYYELDAEDVHVYAENAYVSTGVANLTVSDVIIDGSYLDGKIVIDNHDYTETVKKGDYFCFQVHGSSSVDTYYMRVKSVEKDGSDTEITFTEGLPDAVVTSDSDPSFVSGLSIFTVARVDAFELPTTSWTISSGSVKILDQDTQANYAGSYNGSPTPLVQASLYVGYRCLYTGTSVIEVVSSVSDVTAAAGKPAKENPLGLGVYNAFVGGAPVVYCCATPGDDVEAISVALKRAEMQRTLYYLVPMTQNAEALHAVAAHADSMSTMDSKRWRIAVLCSKVDAETAFNVSVTGFGQYGAADGTDKQTIKFSSSAPVEFVSGDKISFKISNTDYAFTVSRLINSTTILTTAAYDSSIALPSGTSYVNADCVHVYTDTEYAKAVAKAAESYGTFRVVDVFPKKYGYDGEEYNSMFLAATVAGISASVEPQAPITNKVVPAVDDIPETYSKLGESDLDTIASGGVLVVMQELRGDTVYIRKQLTAGASTGNLLKSELSCVKNADDVTQAFNNVLEEFKAAYNVTSGLVSLVRLRFMDVIHALENNQSSNLIGPQLLTGSEVTDVSVDPTNATRIIARVRCVIPAPFNEMDLYLEFNVTTEVETTTEA